MSIINMTRSDSGLRFGQDDLVVMPIENPKYLENWYSYITNLKFSNETEEMEQLRSESSTDEEYKLTFDNARYAIRNVTGLTKAQCVAVTMYTINFPSFFKSFNDRCRAGNWGYYKVYSALLFTACTKLNKKHPIEETEVLYRGLKKNTSLSIHEKFYWPQFTSVTLSKKVAEHFTDASNTILRFSSCVYGARICDLSTFKTEDEVLISPFEAFHRINKLEQNGQTLISFRGCNDQPLLKPRPAISPFYEWFGNLSLTAGEHRCQGSRSSSHSRRGMFSSFKIAYDFFQIYTQICTVFGG